MATDFAREKAAQAWGKEANKHKLMDVELAEAFAEIIDEIMDENRGEIDRYLNR